MFETNYLQNLWGYGAGLVVWVVDHGSVLMAVILFTLQVIYQIYRIKKARQECKPLPEEDDE